MTADVSRAAPAVVREPFDPDWIVPRWDAPRGVGALMTTRAGGVSAGPYASLNLRDEIGDEPVAVAANLARVARSTGAAPVVLRQVHGREVVRLDAAHAASGTARPVADAAVTAQPGIACMVQVADCLPVLFAAPGARAVGAAHAGWRGLAAGVLEATLAQVCALGRCEPGQVATWLGPCIGASRFEVGADVLVAFGVDPDASTLPDRFVPRPALADTVPAARKWSADLAGLARDRLARAGVAAIAAHGGCTVCDAARFYSYRRTPVTGRMAALIWIERD